MLHMFSNEQIKVCKMIAIDNFAIAKCMLTRTV